jgi:hypothetical protein
MGEAIAKFLAFVSLSAGMIAFGWTTAARLGPERKLAGIHRWLLSWSLKGMLVPWCIWLLMNIGLSWYLQPFMPQIQAAQNRGAPWVPELLGMTGIGLMIISSYWTAATLGWFLFSTAGVIEEDHQRDFKILCWTCLLALALPGALIIVFGGWPWLGVALSLMFGPIAFWSPALINPPKLPPIYARAVARLKFGKYAEAEWEIIRELEKAEDDFDGWMMLAELYANNFHDLSEAEKTIREICEQPSVTPSQFSVALHRLADWHLKLGRNPVAARRALQMIIDRLKGTHLARMAQLRIDQIPTTVEELQEQETARVIPLPALGDSLDENLEKPFSNLERKEAARLANACVERLKRNPNNVTVRTKFARILAERLDRVDLAIEQLKLLLGMAGQPEPLRAEWLGLIAAWHMRYRHDPDASRPFLEQLIKEFPQTPQALSAKRRLELMERGQKGGRASSLRGKAN